VYVSQIYEEWAETMAASRELWHDREDSGVFDPLASPCHIDVRMLIKRTKYKLIIKLIIEVVANSQDKYIKTN
jgi:hypothetical protein